MCTRASGRRLPVMTLACRLLLGVALVAAPASAARAQRAPDIAAAVAHDTAAFRTVLAAMRARLTPPLQAAFELAVPTRAPMPWAALVDSLRLTTGSRAELPGDTSVGRAILERAWVEGDTLVAEFVLGVRWSCGNRWLGSAARFELRSRRTTDGWAPAEAQPTMYADPAPCRRAPAPHTEAKP